MRAVTMLAATIRAAVSRRAPLALMFPVKGEDMLVGLLANGEQCKLLRLHKAGDGAVDDG